MEDNPLLNKPCSVWESSTSQIDQDLAAPLYSILLFTGKGTVSSDFADYSFEGNIVLFSTPYQLIRFKTSQSLPVRVLQFHGDFYCIEYHKKEVACNGLLFNNIYSYPFIQLGDDEFADLSSQLNKLSAEISQADTYSEAVVRAYLQLILAISSRVKIMTSRAETDEPGRHPLILFRPLLEKHFKDQRQPSFYAEQLGLSPNAFSKKCRTYFMRSPSQFIQDRVILEAKKLIHLTYKSMKEIAAELKFDDEHYFSRYFKKHTGITPSIFRERVGISRVADLSS